jgi:excisionase family DNA binding protein
MTETPPLLQSHILPEHDIRPYSVAQLADRWGCSDSMIRKLINQGLLQAFNIGVLIRIAAAEVERFEKAPSSGK